MALVFCDDGEQGATYSWNQTSNIVNEAGTGKKDGAYSVGSTGGAAYNIKNFTATYTEFYVASFLRISTAGAAGYTIWWGKDGVSLGYILWNNVSKKFEAYRGTLGSGTLVATGNITQQDAANGGGVFHLQLHVVLDNASGVIQLRHEGSTTNDIDFSGDTLPGADANMNQIGAGLNTGAAVAFDNFWMNDTTGGVNNGWPGVVRCLTQFPTGKSATNDAWTADSGTNKYDRINEQPASGANYIYSETVGQKQGFTYAAIALPAGSSIKALVHTDLPIKISTGGVKQGVRLGGTDYASSAKDLRTTYQIGAGIQHYLEVRPSDSAAWETSDNPESYLETT